MNKEIPDINHKTIVFTKHARERLDLRRLSEDVIIQVMRKPNSTHKLEDGKIRFISKVMGSKVYVICKPILEENKWLVISLWVRGEDDAGNFVNYTKRDRNHRNSLPKLYTTVFIWLIIIVVAIYYFSQ